MNVEKAQIELKKLTPARISVWDLEQLYKKIPDLNTLVRANYDNTVELKLYNKNLKDQLDNSIPRKKVEALRKKLWEKSIDDNCIIRDAGVYQEICAELERLL